MELDVQRERARIARGSAEGWEAFSAELLADAQNDLVNAVWEVTHDEMAHDIVIQGLVKVENEDDALLQVWLGAIHPGIWIPEYRPYVISVVEFYREQNVQSTKVGLFDSKWRKEDLGQKFKAMLWGYLEHDGGVASFAFEKDFTYPGPAIK